MTQMRSPRAVVALAFVPLALVALATPASAQSSTPPKSAAGRAGAAAPQVDANGFKVGEEVLINTPQGWMKGNVVVRAQILHRSPTELVSDFWTTMASVGLKHNSLSLTAAFIKRENENAIKQQEDAGARRAAPKL